MTATLFDSLRWTDRYAAGDVLHDGIRECVVLAVHDCAGGMSGRCVTVEYGDGHRTTFGFDHTFASLGGDAATAGTPSSAVASPQTDSTRPSCAATPGA